MSGVDVVVVTYESAATLRRCLTSVASAVVVDNDSRDGSAELAESLGASVVRAGANLGFAAAANRGAAAGSAPLILFLNPDAALDAGALDALVTAVDSRDDVAVAGPRLVDDGGHEQRAWWPFPSPGGAWAEAFGLHRLHAFRPGSDGTVPFVIGAAFLVRRRAFEEAGGFDESFWLYGEEADLCRRLADLGWKTLYVPGAVARHSGGVSGATSPDRVFEHFQRGTERFIAHHHGRRGLLSYRFALLVGSALRVPALAIMQRREGAHLRLSIVRRLARVLVAHPFEVSR